MRLTDIRPRPGTTKKRKRVGCGTGSGHGKTSTRGHKGAGQHSAPAKDDRFEGGQMPFYRRFPKRGFKNFTRTHYEIVNLERLTKLDSTVIDPDVMKQSGLIRGLLPVKVLGAGAIDKSMEVTAHAFSATAREKIEKAGGKALLIDG